MQKKLLLFIIFVAFVFHSCLDYTPPEKIELEVEGSFNLPVKTSTSTWASTLIKALGEQFPDDMEIYNVNYGQDIQSFCMYIPIGISYSLNPKDYLDKVASALSKLSNAEAALEINEEITISDLDNFTFSSPRAIELPLTGLISPDGRILVDYTPPSLTFPASLPSSIAGPKSYFLNAFIKEGKFTATMVNDGGNVILPDSAITVTITQGRYYYPDVNNLIKEYPGFTASTSGGGQSLLSKEINKKQIDTTVEITLRQGETVQLINPSEPALLKAKLKVSIELSKYDLDWDFSSISNEMQARPLSLADAAKNMNYIEFEKCDVTNEDREPTEGIGINMKLEKLSDKLKSKLNMSITCPELNMPVLGAPSTPKLLREGNNVFGNESELKPLLLGNDNKPGVKELKFAIQIQPAGNDNILHLEDLEAGEVLSMNGEAKLFQHWTVAEVDMAEALKGRPEADGLKSGVFPNKKADGGDNYIDLSIINEYIDGFYFKREDVMAMVYLSGPNDTLYSIDSNLDIVARYNRDEQDAEKYDKLPVLSRNPVTLEKKHVVLKDNPVFLDRNGSYKFSGMPPYGNPIVRFEEILNTHPKDLSFEYNVTLPPTLPVTRKMFDGEVENDIAAAIIVKVNFRLVAVKNPSKIILPDMFGDQKDLLGRNTPDENSMFTSVNVDHLNFAIDLAGTFFTGGRVFLEKNIKADPEQGIEASKPILFPNGIIVDGSKIGINITNHELDIIRKNLINPDLRLEFVPGAAITIPRNMGLISVTIEAKGKNTLSLDF